MVDKDFFWEGRLCDIPDDEVYIGDGNSNRIVTHCPYFENGRFPNQVPKWAMDGGPIEDKIQERNDFFMSRFLFPATAYATVAVNHG
jgi:hypothetical protein